MNLEDLSNLANQPNAIIDDIGNELVGLEMFAASSSSDVDFFQKLVKAGFEGVPLFHKKYAHLEGRVPAGFIDTYNNIAGQVNDRFIKKVLSVGDIKSLGNKLREAQEYYKTV